MSSFSHDGWLFYRFLDEILMAGHFWMLKQM